MSIIYRRFKWSRGLYRKAHHLFRLFGRWDCKQLPSDPPELLRRYFDLRERHRQQDDPLLVPLKYRYDRNGIPF